MMEIARGWSDQPSQPLQRGQPRHWLVLDGNPRPLSALTQQPPVSCGAIVARSRGYRTAATTTITAWHRPPACTCEQTV